MSDEYGFRQEIGGLEEPDRSIGFDRLFELLSDKRRRYALYCFADQQESKVTVSALVDELVALERRASSSECSRREVEISLQHTHLPKLSEMGVVEYERERSEVMYRGGPRLETWVERAKAAELDKPSA